MIKRRDFFHQVLRADILERNDADGDILRTVRIQGGDDIGGKREVLGIVGDNDLVCALVSVNGGLLGKQSLDLFLYVPCLEILEWENFDELLPSFGHFGARGAHQFRAHLWLLAFGNDEDGLAGFNDAETLQTERAVN